MPGKDRTGPEGLGSRTGRQLGKCTPKNDTTPEPESRYGMGRGMGRGVGQAAGRAARAGKGMRQGWRHGGRC